jgi:hypothetical protein
MHSTAHKPDLRPRESGGWLAVTQPDDALRIGVTAATEAEARDRFDEAVGAWERLLAQAAEKPDAPSS